VHWLPRKDLWQIPGCFSGSLAKHFQESCNEFANLFDPLGSASWSTNYNANDAQECPYRCEMPG
jgi:hypothetical protein